MGEQLELFKIEEKIKLPKIKKERPKRGKKHRSREVFQELIKSCRTYSTKAKFSLKEWNKSVVWQEFAKETIKTKQNSCEICESKEKLTLHHMRYDNVTYETYEIDIMIMCNSCHFIFEKHRNIFTYPKVREKYGMVLIERFFDPDNITGSLQEINYLMFRGGIGYRIDVDDDFDHYKTIDEIILDFRSSPFSFYGESNSEEFNFV